MKRMPGRGLVRMAWVLIGAAAWAGLFGATPGPANVVIVVNDSSALSREIGEYYSRRRAIPRANVCRLKVSDAEAISRADFNRDVRDPLARFLQSHHLVETALYLVTTAGVPLKIPESGKGSGMTTDAAAVDSELALLYGDLHGRPHPLSGPLASPFFRREDDAFTHPRFPIYLVTRLAGYDFQSAKGLVDRALAAADRGKYVIDLSDGSDKTGNDWLRTAAILLPKDRAVLDESTDVLYGRRDVIGYASWGSNDPHRKQRFLGFHWLPGAIMTEFVSTNGRTFHRPPDGWNIATWQEPKLFFDGSPQTLTADYVLEGVTGASGHVYEPFLQFTPRPDILLPAYAHGRNLAESYYLSIPALSWQNIVIGDPLCRLK